jgi:hypothetical protein
MQRVVLVAINQRRHRQQLLLDQSIPVAVAQVEMELAREQLVVMAVMVEAASSLFVMRAPCLRVHQLNHALVHTLLSDSKQLPNARGMFPLE